MRSAETAAVLPYGPAWLRPFFQSAGPATHAVMRIAVALLFMQHGAQKLFGWLGGMDQAGGTAPLASLMGVAGVLEVGGGALLLVGLLTRPLALVLLVQMIAAYVIAHLPQGGFPVQNQGELALLYGATFLFLFGNGAGPLSIDRWLGQRRARHHLPATIRSRIIVQPGMEAARRRRDTAA